MNIAKCLFSPSTTTQAHPRAPLRKLTGAPKLPAPNSPAKPPRARPREVKVRSLRTSVSAEDGLSCHGLSDTAAKPQGRQRGHITRGAAPRRHHIRTGHADAWRMRGCGAGRGKGGTRRELHVSSLWRHDLGVLRGLTGLWGAGEVVGVW